MTHTDVCREGCGRFVLGTPATPAAVVIANVYADEDGHTLLDPAATRARWVRTVIFHGACYDNRYGPARTSVGDADLRRRARPLHRAS